MSFAENLYALYPGQAKDWLAALPAFLKSIETKLSIHIAAPFSNLTYSSRSLALSVGLKISESFPFT